MENDFKKYYREYYQANREKRLKNQKKYYLKNKERILKSLKERNKYRKEERKKYREKNKDKIRLYYRNWYARNGRNRNPSYIESVLEWQQLFPERVKAMQKLNDALRIGGIVKPANCKQCGRTTRLHGHHANYEDPLNVMWLCASCHKIEHNK